MPAGRRPPLSQKSLDFMRSQFNPPRQQPEQITKQQRIARLLEWATIATAAGFVLSLLFGPLVWLADLLLARDWIERWVQVSAAFGLLWLLCLLPKRIRTAPAKAVLLSIGILTVTHALYASILQQQSLLAVSRTAIIAWGIMFLWKALDLIQEHTRQPTLRSRILAALCLIGGVASLFVAVLYAYPTLFNLTLAELEAYHFPTFAFMSFGIINIILSDMATTKDASGKASS